MSEAPDDLHVDQAQRSAIDRFAQAVLAKFDELLEQDKAVSASAIARQAVAHALSSFTLIAPPPVVLSVEKLKAEDVIGRGMVGMSLATLYRAVKEHRFYCTREPGRKIMARYPAWQFTAPVPELIGPILKVLADQPGNDIQAFWVTAAVDLSDLSPAEVLAGRPFETRMGLHSSQQRILALPAAKRAQMVHRCAVQMVTWHVDVG
jgi:hypothetical protein